jgi:hypothetical protein
MKQLSLFLVLALFAIVGAQCEPQGEVAKAGPRSWIDKPLSNSSLALGKIEVLSHSSDLLRIVLVELSVNGAVVRTDPNPDSGKTLAKMSQEWTPPGPGNYTLMVRAQNSTGIWGDYAQALVTIGGVSGGTVQGAVYSDLNSNGLPNDPGDAPLDGVVVTLSGCASKTTTTVNGTFQFTGLPAGTCLVEVSKSGWKFSGTYPAGIGYPAKAASDPAKPTAFSLFMTPLTTPTPTPPPKPGAPPPLPAVSIAFFADQLTLVFGQCTTIHWQVTNASQVFLDNASVALSGSKQDCPTQTTTHSLRVITLDNQTAQRSLTITVVPVTITPTRTFTPTAPPPVRGCSGTPNISSFSASPSSIIAGQSATLNWGAVTNADSVEIGPDIGGVATPGSMSVSPGSTTTYTLLARCGSNTVTRQATVTVTSRGIIIIPTPTLVPILTPIRVLPPIVK